MTALDIPALRARAELARHRGLLLVPDYNTLAALLDAAEAMAGVRAAARDVLAERRRQIEGEGWTESHDDDQSAGDMARAAAAYAYIGSLSDDLRKYHKDDSDLIRTLWPKTWWSGWWKPKDRRRDLVRAGALILAEIERLDRVAALSASPLPAAPAEETE